MNLKCNIVANLVGNLWTVIVSIALVPLYIHFMGIEAYGLVGFFAAMQALLALLDFGLSTTLNREMARLSALPDMARHSRDLVRTLELIYWAVGIFIGSVILGVAPFIADQWVQAKTMPMTVVRQSVMMMGLILLFQWPSSFYSGGLLGLQRQVLLNVATVISVTLRGVGVIFILWLISPTIQAFFLWQTVVSAMTTLAIRLLLWRSLPSDSEAPRFNRHLLKSIWSFAAGTTGLSIQGVILTQQDKVILSKWVPLDVFGYYSLAASVAQNLGRLIAPVTAAVFPRFTHLHEQRDEEKLAHLYHQSCQLLAVLIFPAAVMLAFFSSEILRLWTRNPETVKQTHLLLSLLAIGAALNSIMYIPSILQTSVGWLSLALYFNTVSIVTFVPLTMLLTHRYGGVGAASCWIGLNALYVLTAPHFIHGRLLIREKWKWYREDVGGPFVMAVLAAWICQRLMVTSLPAVGVFLYLALTYLVILLAVMVCAKEIRTLMSAQMAHVFAWTRSRSHGL